MCDNGLDVIFVYLLRGCGCIKCSRVAAESSRVRVDPTIIPVIHKGKYKLYTMLFRRGCDVVEALQTVGAVAYIAPSRV
jgi:hypothetical protein